MDDYRSFLESDLQVPEVIPVFPLAGALLLPRVKLPLNVFEPRYLRMVDDALAGNRIIGIVQPQGDGRPEPALQRVGCAGRISGFSETGDGRYHITLTGTVRFTVVEELRTDTPYRICRATADPFGTDSAVTGEADVDRETLLETFRAFLDENELDADWDSVESASNESLVNGIAMIGPYDAAEKQALLEAPDLKTRAETLVALTEISLARSAGPRTSLQ